MQSPTLRQPSDRAQLYAWHADALDALATGRKTDLKELAAIAPELMPPIQEGAPQCGYYKAKVATRAVLVPAKIYLESVVGEDGQLVQPERLKCEIGDKEFDPADVWARLCIRPISRAEYVHLMALRQWADQSKPDQPQASRNDGKPVDWMKVDLSTVPQQPQQKERKR
jgi:hypothetical protein